MSYPVYYIQESDTLVHLFDTFDGGTGASITMSGLATSDILIYKDGSVTQRSSTSGFTLLDTDGIDFDSLTGIHGFSIDLSDNTDAGFYTVGPWYHVVISSITVDTQTVSFVACAFRIVSATRGLAGTALPDAAADAAGGLVISDAGGLDIDTTDSNVTAILADTADMQPKLGTPAGASISADIAVVDGNVDSILTDTAEIGAAGAGLTEAGGTGDQLTAIPWNAAWDAEVQSEVDDGLVARGLDHLVNVAVTGADITDDSIIAQLASASATADWDTYDNTTDSLEANQAEHDQTQSDIAGLNDPTAAAIADAVWDEAIAGHLGAGSTGEALNAAGAAGDPWTTALPGAYGAGSAGFIVGNNLDASVADVEADTQDIQGRLPAALVSGRMDSNMQAAANGVITAAVIATDAVDADALAADAVAEIQSGLATSANQTTILNRLGAFTGSGFNTILGFLQALMRSDATTPSDLGGTYDDATDSLQAIRDRGDAAWITATGFSTHSAADVADAVWEEAIADHSGTVGSTAEALDAAGGGSTPAAIADAVWDEVLAGHLVAGSTGAALSAASGGSSPGAVEFTYTVTNSVTTNPVDGCEVWFTTDLAGNNVVWVGLSDTFGVARDVNGNKPLLDPGTYYVWKQLAGYIIDDQPDTEVVA